ncbi:hypothetical protein Sjap_024290 [Stephania japonica]|uniref:Mediator complex subunit 22 n=1 Tax=Stephania japonica TaxID=461633 RepID=A0AAP0EIF9_9MAGN
MNKGGGLTTAPAQKQKNLLQRADAEISSLLENFGLMVNVVRVNDPPVRNSQESFMLEMCAAKMVQAADSLLKLVSELKQTAIFSNFVSLNEHVERRTIEFNLQSEKTNRSSAEIDWGGSNCQSTSKATRMPLLFIYAEDHSI